MKENNMIKEGVVIALTILIVGTGLIPLTEAPLRALTEPEIVVTVNTDKPSYFPGEQVIIFGQVTVDGEGYPAGYCPKVIDPDNYTIWGGTICYGTDPNGTYEITDFYLSPSATLGTYTVHIHFTIYIDPDLYEVNGSTTFEVVAESTPPTIPYQPWGRRIGFKNQPYTYCTNTTDPEGDDLFYMWDWGDGHMSDWLGPYLSGEQACATHAWTAPGYYFIRVKAKDINGLESNWSEPWTIRILGITVHHVHSFSMPPIDL